MKSTKGSKKCINGTRDKGGYLLYKLFVVRIRQLMNINGGLFIPFTNNLALQVGYLTFSDTNPPDTVIINIEIDRR